MISTYPAPRAGNGQFAIVPAPVYVNVHLMFMANFAGRSYGTGLEAISNVIACFQQTPWLTRANAPDLGPEVDKVTLEMESPGAVEVNYVMGMMGLRYLPSVFYKLRMLPFASAGLQGRTYPVRTSGQQPSDTSGAR